MFNKKHNVISAVIVAIVLTFSMYTYRENVETDLNANNRQMLAEFSAQQQSSIFLDLKENLFYLDNLALATSQLISEDEIPEYSFEILDPIYQTGDFLFNNMIIANLNGDAILFDGSPSNVSDFDFFNEAVDNDNAISSLTFSPYTNSDTIFFSSSIYHNNEKTGVLIAEFEPSEISTILSPTFDGQGSYIILDENGNIISSTETSSILLSDDNVLHLNEYISFSGNESVSDLATLLKTYISGISASITVDGDTELLNFTSIEGTKWTLAMAIPEDVISKTSNSIILNTFLISTEVIIILLSVLFSTLNIHKKYTSSVEKVAYYDKLTGLINETKFKIEAKKLLNSNPDTQYIIAKMDIINFKVVNELYDYNMGDRVLSIVAEALKTVASDKFLVAKDDGDEFLLFTDANHLDEIFSNHSNYEDLINQGIAAICPREFKFRYSRYLIPVGEKNIDDIINTLTLTHNHHRKELQNTSSFYDFEDSLKLNLLHTAHICDIMRDALENEEFKVYLQPKNNIKTKLVCGAEALVRWQRPDNSFIFPNEFINIFEQEGFIVELDKYMLKKVCVIINRFLSNGHRVPISINFSRLHMLNENFSAELETIVDAYNVPHELIEIEMTETSMMQDIESFKALFSKLKSKGFTLSIDDFGAGYSSFDLLADLDFDILKIDKSLLDNAENSTKRQIVIQTIVDMANNLSLKSVCEGVETVDQYDFLNDINCDIAQGYLFSRPIPNENFDKLLEK